MDVLGGIARLHLHTLQSLRWSPSGGAWRSRLRPGANFNITSRGRSVLLSWAPFIFTCKVRSGSWRATCPYHSKNKTTCPPKVVIFGPAFARRPVLAGMVLFSTPANSQKHHVVDEPDIAALSRSAVLEVQMSRCPPADQPTNGDDELFDFEFPIADMMAPSDTANKEGEPMAEQRPRQGHRMQSASWQARARRSRRRRQPKLRCQEVPRRRRRPAAVTSSLWKLAVCSSQAGPS